MWGRESRFPYLCQAFFSSKSSQVRPSFRVHFCSIDLRSVIYWVQSCYSFLHEDGVMLHLFIEIHACSSLQELRTLFSSALDSSAPVPARHYHVQCMPGSIFSCTETKEVGCLITIYQHWTFAISPMGKGQPLLATLEATLCLLTRKYCSCIQWQPWCPVFRDSSFPEGKFYHLVLWAICRKISAKELSTISKSSRKCLLNHLLFELKCADTCSCDFPKTSETQN